LKGVDHESNPCAGGISLFCRFRAAGAAILVRDKAARSRGVYLGIVARCIVNVWM
jgi:hypothetical protein